MELHSNEFQKYYKMLVKRRYLFIASALLIMSVVVWGSFFLPKQYEAKSTVFIERSVIKDMVKGLTITPSIDDKIRVLRYAMLSRENVLNVLKKLDYDVTVKNDKALEEMVAGFQGKTDINIKGSDLFFVSYTDKDPQRAMEYVNALVRSYVESNASSKREDAYGANRFITEQVKLYKDKVDQAEEAIIKYRQSKGVYMSVDDRALISDIKAYQTEMDTMRIRRNELVATRNSIKQQLTGEEPFTVAVLNTRKGGGSSDAQITMRENRIKQLLSSYTENYPEIIKLKAEIEGLKTQPKSLDVMDKGTTESEMSTLNPIHQDLKQRLSMAESELSAIDAKLRQLGSVIGRKEGELRNIPTEKLKLAELEKERDAHRTIYEQLLARQGQSEVSKQMEVEDKATNFRIVDPAVVPTKPVSPNRVRLILLGILAGFAGAAGIVFLRETIDTSVRESATIKQMGLEVIAVIPRIFNAAEEERIKKRDRLVYIIAGSYMLIIVSALIHEVMGFTLLESLINQFGFTL
ncbi:XrtA system polysaccharide chain length determinant [Geobacter sp.]|uniref:XrtA system polysaccharide chain length determinant n=1 Tax=Geobacter sp. TaxID=46610 RepID=UPI0027B8C253|nr:XrtA system polysaccharide chain length determinant [Geobacter sp.]